MPHLVRYIGWHLPDFVVRRCDAGVSDARMEAVIGRLHHVIVGCPDPAALAACYSELLGLPITWREDGFVVVSRDGTSSASPSSWRLASSRRSGLIRAGRSRCISMSWSMGCANRRTTRLGITAAKSYCRLGESLVIDPVTEQPGSRPHLHVM